MYFDKRKAQSNLRNLLRNEGLTVSDSASGPLKRIDFDNLIDVYDHEEAFLRDTLIRCVVSAREARISDSPSSSRNVIPSDIRAALLMLGEAAAKSDLISDEPQQGGFCALDWVV